MNIYHRYRGVLNYFRSNMPDVKTELHYKNEFELLVAVILSAQCTDKRVNIITENLFNLYPTALTMSKASIEELYEAIKSCSYPNNKAKHLYGMSKILVDKFSSRVPSTEKELTELPGVGRKTANVIQAVVYNKPVMPVDTHVFRVSNRVGLTNQSKSPDQTEKVLLKYISQDLLTIAHHWLLLHGRYICTAQKPKCRNCIIYDYCEFKDFVLIIIQA